jgi:hypothetical protein
MLAIEDKLSEIRSDIESAEAQFLHMQKQVAYSSLDLTFYSKRTAQETGKGFFYKLRSSLVHGWDFMLSLFVGLLSFWPLVIIAILLFLWSRRLKKRKKRSPDLGNH